MARSRRARPLPRPLARAARLLVLLPAASWGGAAAEDGAADHWKEAARAAADDRREQAAGRKLLGATKQLSTTVAEVEVAEVDAVAEVGAEAIGEECVSALATREGRSREQVLAALSHKPRKGAPPQTCDLAVATASPIGIYLGSLAATLGQPGPIYQLAVSVASVAVGAACAWDGPVIWRWLFTATAAAVAAGVTHHEAALWNLAPTLISELVLMGQAAAATALAVHVGFEGSQVLFGALLGLVGAYGLGDWARSLEGSAPGLSLLWYEIGAVLGFLLYTVWRKAVLSTLAPLVGGFLMTVGLSLLLSRLVGAFSSEGWPILPPGDASWFDAANTLLGKAGVLAMSVHCAGAMLATLIHGIVETRWITVLFLVGNIVTSALSASTGCFCNLWPSMHCPQWLQQVEDWPWPVVGCLIWACVTGLSAWRQLGMLEAWEASNFWRSDTARCLEGSDSHKFGGGPAPAGYDRAGGTPRAGPLGGVARGLEGWWTSVSPPAESTGQRRF